MNKCRIIFSDIDGTLLNSRHRISPGTQREIHRVTTLGIPFVLVSSRMPASILAIQKSAGITGPVIALGGSLILDEDRRPLFDSGIPPIVAAAAGRLIEREFPQITWNMYSGFHWMCAKEKSHWITREEKIVGFQAECGDLCSLFSWKSVHKILCMGDPVHISALENRLISAFPELSVCRSAPYYLEVVRSGLGKGTAISLVCTHKNIPLEHAYAFGDNYNDLDMLKTAGTAFVMGNAPAEIKELIGNVTRDNDHDGIAAVLRHI